MPDDGCYMIEDYQIINKIIADTIIKERAQFYYCAQRKYI